MMIEPMMLILAFFIFFFFAFTYVRLDFSISKDEGQEVRLKVAGFCEKICALQVSNFWHNVKVNFNIKNHPGALILQNSDYRSKSHYDWLIS